MLAGLIVPEIGLKVVLNNANILKNIAI